MQHLTKQGVIDKFQSFKDNFIYKTNCPRHHMYNTLQMTILDFGDITQRTLKESMRKQKKIQCENERLSSRYENQKERSE